jgi:hypothetical protein
MTPPELGVPLILALGRTPKLPGMAAATSDKMSPNVLSERITPFIDLGLTIIIIAAESAS